MMDNDLGTIRFPCHPYIEHMARRYADASQSYTKLYGGWDSGDKTYKRILVGRFGQEWMRAFCLANGVPCETDDTDHRTPDKFDLRIGGRIVDVKTSENLTL